MSPQIEFYNGRGFFKELKAGTIGTTNPQARSAGKILQLLILSRQNFETLGSVQRLERVSLRSNFLIGIKAQKPRTMTRASK